MGISALLSALTAIQASLVVPANTVEAQPDPIKIVHAYEYTPPQSVGGLHTPCWTNEWTLIGAPRSPSLQETMYDIRMMLYIEDSEVDRGAKIANAFFDQFLLKLGENLTLSGSIHHHELTGGTPTGVIWTWGNLSYTGLDLHLAATTKEVATFGA